MRKSSTPEDDMGRSRIMHGLLESVQRDGAGSQRDRASEFGVALGLVNAYLNYCVRKGHIRVKKIPAKRYIYYLTPKGFAEKSRLAVTLISNSFHSFRQAREEYTQAIHHLKASGANRVVLVGASELAEVSVLCAAESEITLVAIVDPSLTESRFVGLPVVAEFAAVPGGFDGAIITDLADPMASYARALELLDADLVLAPAILGITSSNRGPLV